MVYKDNILEIEEYRNGAGKGDTMNVMSVTKSRISTDEKYGNQDYGFLWWLPHGTDEVIAAVGDGGNIIYIDRKNKITAAITAYFKPMVFDRTEFVEKNIVEALLRD